MFTTLTTMFGYPIVVEHASVEHIIQWAVSNNVKFVTSEAELGKNLPSFTVRRSDGTKVEPEAVETLKSSCQWRGMIRIPWEYYGIGAQHTAESNAQRNHAQSETETDD